MSEIELKEARAMLYLPENCVELRAVCKVFEDGKLIEVEKLFGIGDMKRAFRDAEMNYSEDTDLYSITPSVLAFLKESEVRNADKGE